MGRLVPLPLAVLLACSIDTSGLGTGPPADGGADAGGLDAAIDGETEIDAGQPAIVGPVTLGPSGARNAHPAVVWSGDVFVVAYFADDGEGGRNVVARAARPGEELTPVSDITMTAGVARSSLSLAHAAGQGTAIGWVEGAGTPGVLHVRVLPSSPRGTFEGVEIHHDYDDAHVMWDRGVLLAVLRQGMGANELLTSVEFTPGPGAIGSVSGPMINFGEIASASSGAGPLLVAAEAGVIWVRREDGFWSEAHRLSFGGTPMEGDVVELTGGHLLGVFGVNDGTGVTLRSQRLDSAGDGRWIAVLPETRLSTWLGPDQVLASITGDRALLAWVDETSSPPPRPLALAVLDATGMPVGASPCIVEPERAYANDPDIACGGGWCAVVWMEADDLLSESYVTRFMQLPITGGSTLACPTEP